MNGYWRFFYWNMNVQKIIKRNILPAMLTLYTVYNYNLSGLFLITSQLELNFLSFFFPPPHIHFTIMKCLEVWADTNGSSDTVTSLKCFDYFLASQKFLSGLLMCETLLWHEMTRLMLRGRDSCRRLPWFPQEWDAGDRWRSLRSHASSSALDWEAWGPQSSTL